MKSKKTIGFVIMVDDKYYYKHTKKRVTLSYCVTGAKIFNENSNIPFILDTEEFLNYKGFITERKFVCTDKYTDSQFSEL